MNSEINQSIRDAFHKAKRVVIVSHIRPDGDAIGATIGLGIALQKAGKSVELVIEDGLPRNFRFLKGSDQVHHRIKREYDLSIVLDCSDLHRTGDVFGNQQPDINIDHHITNLNFAHLNFVLPEAVATSAILAEFLLDWDLEINTDVADALLMGILSDTIGFRTSNVTGQALHLAANLVEYGANMPELYNQVLVRRSYEAALYWGQGLSRLKQSRRINWTYLTLDDRRKAGYTGNDDADLINILSTVDDIDISVIFLEQKGKQVKISWRAMPGFDVSQIAFHFGGGGHKAAAGAEIPGNLDEVMEKVLNATFTMVERQMEHINGDKSAVVNSSVQGYKFSG